MEQSPSMFRCAAGDGCNARALTERLMLRMLIVTTTLSLLACGDAHAQSSPRLFVGAAAGISTLSADAQSQITPARVDVSALQA